MANLKPPCAYCGVQGERRKGCGPQAAEALKRSRLYTPPLGSPVRALGQIPATNVSKAP